jgi:hypothetical protein
MAPPVLWPWLGGEEVRGPTSVAVPIDGTGTASVAPAIAPLVPGVQKPPCRVGKRFRDRLVVAPEEKMKKPAGLNPVESCLRPWRRSNQSGVLYPLCTVPVYKPAAIH